MKTIWKFPLGVADQQSIRAPGLEKVLSVQLQGKQPMLWGVVNTDKPDRTWLVQLVGTGHPVNDLLYDSRHFVDTFQVYELVFHVFAYDTGPIV